MINRDITPGGSSKTENEVVEFLNEHHDEVMRILNANHSYWLKKRILDAANWLVIGLMWLAFAALILGVLILFKLILFR